MRSSGRSAASACSPPWRSGHELQRSASTDRRPAVATGRSRLAVAAGTGRWRCWCSQALRLRRAASRQRPLVPIAAWISAAIDWFTAHFRFLFRGITWLLDWPLGWCAGCFDRLAWPVGHRDRRGARLCRARGCGWRLFCALGAPLHRRHRLLGQDGGDAGLVAVAVPLSVAIGLFGGILAFRSAAARRVIEPVLDLMQTIPTFAYLIPILVLFGIGPVVGMIASAIYAVPPMVRNVMLGLQRVQPEIVEVGEDVGLDPAPAPVVGRCSVRPADDPDRRQPDRDGGAQHGGDRRDGRRRRRYRHRGLPVDEAGEVRREPAFRPGDRADRDGHGPHSAALRQGGIDPRQRGGAAARFGWRSPVAAVGCRRWRSSFRPLANYPEAWVIHPAPALNAALEWFTVAAFPVTSALKTWIVFCRACCR